MYKRQIEQSRYLPVPGTMFVISTEEVHKGTILDSEDYERYVIPVSYTHLDPTYITSHKNARSLIMKVERDEILEELMRVYIDTMLK